MSPVRVDSLHNKVNIEQILKTIQTPQGYKSASANKSGSGEKMHNSSQLNFKDFIEQELNVPKAAAIKIPQKQQ